MSQNKSQGRVPKGARFRIPFSADEIAEACVLPQLNLSLQRVTALVAAFP
jgi:hypothetical protein